MTGTVRLDTAGPFAVHSAMASLAAHAVPGAERVDRDARTVTRLLKLPGGPTEVTATLADDHVELAADFATADDVAVAARVTRHRLDLDADVERIDAVLAADSSLRPLVHARPGLRVIGHVDGFEAAISTVLGQQVSLAAARTFTGRLIAAYGTPHPCGLTEFPGPGVLAGVAGEELRAAVGITRARTRTLHALAEAFADGLVLHPGGDTERQRRELLALPGIGPWTVEYLALRAFGDRDACPAGDLVLRRALGADTAAEAHARAHAWSPYRAYGVFHLWTETAYLNR
ncbi:DNA-3-methyladenine glycosylase [Saccharopolyspora gloriosae]|uniref:DNA-3-methyladenine glycosylase family protein n=1 Tax=Saccharopolyspora gloriosae TaxID=455344 RepID=UPI001FB750B4|nr:AlkA N-terminal domain-containing protein [Saccharopolyspora gloriosae]